jgi:thioredoxin 1
MADHGKMLDVTDATFEQQVLKSNLSVMVDFWAVWCGPCKMLEPTVEAVAAEYAGKVIFARLNVDDSPETAIRYGVKSIPTLILFRDGAEQDRLIGVNPKDTIVRVIDRHLH